MNERSFILRWVQQGLIKREAFDSLKQALAYVEDHGIPYHDWAIVGPGNDDYLYFVYSCSVTRDLSVDLVEDNEELSEVLDELLEG